MSSKIWSKLEESLPPFERALIIISESPSSCTWFRQSSFAKTKALRAANTSTISTDVGSGIVCVKAAMIRPLSLRITPSRPAKFRSLKVALSKLTFIQPDGGGVQLIEDTDLKAGWGTDRARWNSCKLSVAKPTIFDIGAATSPTLSLFLQVHS